MAEALIIAYNRFDRLEEAEMQDEATARFHDRRRGLREAFK
jgi:hypothetical protein